MDSWWSLWSCLLVLGETVSPPPKDAHNSKHTTCFSSRLFLSSMFLAHGGSSLSWMFTTTPLGGGGRLLLFFFCSQCSTWRAEWEGSKVTVFLSRLLPLLTTSLSLSVLTHLIVRVNFMQLEIKKEKGKTWSLCNPGEEGRREEKSNFRWSHFNLPFPTFPRMLCSGRATLKSYF